MHTQKSTEVLLALEMSQPCSWKIINIVSSLLKRRHCLLPLQYAKILTQPHVFIWNDIYVYIFLPCRCKYLFLLFDDSFLVDQNYIFTTEGHPLPVLSAWHDRLPEAYIPTNWSFVKVLPHKSAHTALLIHACLSEF